MLIFTDDPLRTFPRIRDIEQSREAPPGPSQAGYIAAESAFLSAVQESRDDVMRSERGAGWPASVHLGECNAECQALLFKACHEAMAGRNNTAAELMRDFVRAVAADYADNEEGAYL